MSRINGISVENLLEMEVMKDCKLLAGFKSSKNTISRINIMADPDIVEWTTSGEFLLTTSYFFEKSDIREQISLIKRCYESNLAGIGVKISPDLGAISQEILDLADELNFPIVDIEYSIPLSDIMMGVFKEIFNKQASLLERLERVHERLMHSMLRGSGLENIIKILQENIKNPVVLSLILSGETFKQVGEKSQDFEENFDQEVKSFYENRNTQSKLRQLTEDEVLIKGRYIKRMIMPIILRNQVYGHLFFWGTETPLGGFDLSIIESVSTTIALFILQQLSLKEVEIRYSSEYFEDLISLDASRKKKALDRAKFFNLNNDDYYIVEVLSFKGETDDEELEDDLNYMQEFSNPMVNSIETLMERSNLKGIVSTKGHGIQILLNFKNKDQVNDILDEFNGKLLEIILKRKKDIDLKIGVGRLYKELTNVEKSFQDAIRAVRIGKVISAKNIIYYDELGIFKILSQDFLNYELEDFYNTTLKVLVEYDDKKSTELVPTLSCFFKNSGNLTRISEELFTHYNTVLYRIKRIEEITGVNLNDPSERLNLEIAIKIKELLEK
nr:PucR family transcriptional regulator [Tissierella sp.]